jgi:tetraacyldisaccharide 4'-kinase
MIISRNFYLQLMAKGPVNFWGWLVLFVLWPLSCLYGLVIWLRGYAYSLGVKRVYRAPVPVVSVGNLAVGGTGKTPVVDALVKNLTARGRNVAVVSRGYKGSFVGESCLVAPDKGVTAEEAGDEPFLLAIKNPDARVYVARKRKHGVAAAVVDGADCIVLDDAFQHLAVVRDLDIVLLDARNPFGNGCLLPAGLLREHPQALNRADLLILTHCATKEINPFDDKKSVQCSHRFANYLLDAEGNRLLWSQVTGKRCLAFAGIAHPEDFFSKLRDKGCLLRETLALADHQDFGSETLARIITASQDVDFLLTTEKDAVKLAGVSFPKPCLSVPLELEFKDFEPVERLVDSMLAEYDK